MYHFFVYGNLRKNDNIINDQESDKASALNCQLLIHNDGLLPGICEKSGNYVEGLLLSCDEEYEYKKLKDKIIKMSHSTISYSPIRIKVIIKGAILEAETMAPLNHPDFHTVQFHDYFEYLKTVKKIIL
jgi:hypothetical protein